MKNSTIHMYKECLGIFQQNNTSNTDKMKINCCVNINS